MPAGNAAAYMNGCRRPQRDRKWSDHRPISGSRMTSARSDTTIAAPTSTAGIPTTWLK